MVVNIAIALLATLAQSPSLTMQPPGTAKYSQATDFNHIYTAMSLDSGRLAQIESYYAPSYVYRDSSGRTLNWLEYRKALAAEYNNGTSFKATYSLENITVKGSIASVDFGEQIQYLDITDIKVAESVRATGQLISPRKVEISTQAVDIWRRSSSGWVLIGTKELHSNRTINGKSPLPWEAMLVCPR